MRKHIQQLSKQKVGIMLAKGAKYTIAQEI